MKTARWHDARSHLGHSARGVIRARTAGIATLEDVQILNLYVVEIACGLADGQLQR